MIEPPRDPALHVLFDREFQYSLREFPEYATFLGVDSYNDRLRDRSPEAVARRRAHVTATLVDLAAFDPAKLPTQDRVSLAMMTDNLRRANALNAL